MKKERLPLKTIIINGVLNGFFFALAMAAYYYYFTDDPFSWKMFLIHFLCFGFFMAITFRYKYSKKK